MDIKPLRLAFLLPTFPELSNTFVLEQVKGMIERGHHVDVFARSAKDLSQLPPDLQNLSLEQRMRHLPIPHSRAARIASATRLLAGPKGLHPAFLDALNPWQFGKTALNLVQLHTAASFVQSGPYDILHCHYGQYGIIGERLVRKKATGAALVTSFRGADLSSHYPKNPKKFGSLFRAGDLHLPVSAEFRRRLLAAGVPPDRVITHHDGIDIRRFPFVERRTTDGAATLLFVGRLVEKKGVVYALEAMAELIHAGRKAKLRIIGTGPLDTALKARSRELGLTEHVAFEGARPNAEVADAMRSAHIFVAPSVTAEHGDQEGIPTVLKEAMSTGMPVVSTHHSGIPELVEHGVTGYLAPERDVSKLAKHLARLIDRPDRWTDIGRAGRMKVEQEFDTQQLNDDLVERYREAMARRTANAKD